MHAEVVVDRPIIKQSQLALDDVPYPELAQLQGEAEERLAMTFHYLVPRELLGQVQIGQLVSVPFRTEQLQAIIIDLSRLSPIDDPRPLAAILDPQPVVTPAQIRLARWLCHEYLAPLSQCLKLFLPPGANRKAETILKPIPLPADHPVWLDAPSQILLTYLRQHGQARLAEIDAHVADTLLNRGLARQETVLTTPRVGPKLDRTVELSILPDEIDERLLTFGRQTKRANLIHYLAQLDDPLPDLDDVLQAVECGKSVAQALADNGLVQLIPKQRLIVATRVADQEPSGLTLSSERSNTKQIRQQNLLTYVQQHGSVLRETLLRQTNGKTTNLSALLEQKLLRQIEEPHRISLTVPAEQLLDTLINLRGTTRHAEVLRVLAEEEGPVWIGWLFARTQATNGTLRDLAQAELISVNEVRRWRDPLVDKVFTLSQPPPLTPAQQSAWQTIEAMWDRPSQPILLYGITGSGKTEVYMRAMAHALERGQQALLLVPEITLATQIVARVAARFPGQVAVMHSALSPGERFDTWERIRRQALPIVVGPRSALFAPLQNLGLVVVDEEHEAAYKQSLRTPRFHGRETALKLAELNQALIILGSASPDVATYRQAEQGRYRLLTLPTRPVAHRAHVAKLLSDSAIRRFNDSAKDPLDFQNPTGLNVSESRQQVGESLKHRLVESLPLPKVEIVDLREELKAGNRSIFSRALYQALGETIQRGEQALLFLNRRGTATFVNCRDCGYVQQCPQCDTTLTYHGHDQRLICHYCGFQQAAREICPDCGGTRIRYFGLGTQRVEDTVKQLFPDVTVVRWDQDTTRHKGSHEALLHHFVSGEAQIMVGTQMVAKGLDLPLVTLVGVISADTSLYLPDFRATERTFQLLMQVAGRAGRSPLGGRVIVQSYSPDLPVIQAAARHDYLGFYRSEIAFRHSQRYPPFKRLATLFYSGAGEERSAGQAQQMTERLQNYVARYGLSAVEIVGPTPHYVHRLRTHFRWNIFVWAKDPASVLRPLLPLPNGWRVTVDPLSML